VDPENIVEIHPWLSHMHRQTVSITLSTSLSGIMNRYNIYIVVVVYKYTFMLVMCGTFLCIGRFCPNYLEYG